jgi:predicted XRE-type DNA-binding protein
MTRYEWLQTQIEYLREYPQQECVEWPFGHNSNGYGQVWNGKKLILVHRESYRLYTGQGPIHMACHQCDNPPCYNPIHLYDGTAKQNQQDAVQKGHKLLARGLTEQQVIDVLGLLSQGMTQTEVAAKFGVVQTYISAIKNGKVLTFRHLLTAEPSNGKYKLTEQNVIEIIGMLERSDLSHAKIARRFGVAESTVWAIRHNVTWKYCPRPWNE